MEFATTFSGRIYNRLAQHASVRADCADIAAEADSEIERLRVQVTQADKRGDEAMHRLRVAERVLQDLVRRCEGELADPIDVHEIQSARAVLGLEA